MCYYFHDLPQASFFVPDFVPGCPPTLLPEWASIFKQFSRRASQAQTTFVYYPQIEVLGFNSSGTTEKLLTDFFDDAFILGLTDEVIEKTIEALIPPRYNVSGPIWN